MEETDAKQMYVLELSGMDIGVIRDALDIAVKQHGLKVANVCLQAYVALNGAKKLVTPESKEPQNDTEPELLEETPQE